MLSQRADKKIYHLARKRALLSIQVLAQTPPPVLYLSLEISSGPRTLCEHTTFRPHCRYSPASQRLERYPSGRTVLRARSAAPFAQVIRSRRSALSPDALHVFGGRHAIRRRLRQQ